MSLLGRALRSPKCRPVWWCYCHNVPWQMRSRVCGFPWLTWIRKEEKQRRLDPHHPRDRLGLSHPQAANVKGETRREIPGGGWVSRTGSHVAPRHRGRRTPLVIRTPQPGLGGGWLLTAEGNFLSEAWSGLAGCSELVAGSPARIEPAIRRACLSV